MGVAGAGPAGMAPHYPGRPEARLFAKRFPCCRRLTSGSLTSGFERASVTLGRSSR